MLKRIKELVLGEKPAAAAETEQERQELALAAVLVEMARADFDEAEQEQSRIVALLASHFELTADEATALMRRAETALDDSVSLFGFTRAMHEVMSAEERLEVIRLLWQVALADNNIDKYEDYLVRKVADLLYVSHSDVVRIKNEVAGI